MNDFQLTSNNLDDLFNQLQDELSKKPLLIISVQDSGKPNWGMSRLWRAWIKTVADFMASNGVTMPLMIDVSGMSHGKRPFNEVDAHDLFSSHFLPSDADGTRISWSKNGRDGMRPATKGERFMALTRLEQWATEKGIKLFNPRDSEYENLKKEGDV